MLANVVVRAQLALAVAHNEDALVANFNYKAVTNVIELFCATDKDPALGKNLFHFVIEYFG